MEDLHMFVQWAEDNGIQFNGVRPSYIPNRGIGVRATRPLEIGDTIFTIPMNLVHSIDTVPEHISGKLYPHASTHGILAAQLAVDKEMLPAFWSKLLPKHSDFKETMPIMWPAELQGFLPQHAKGVLKKQAAMFSKDWEVCNKAFPNLRREDYLYAWLVINSRTFYYESPNITSAPWQDRLALLPAADLLNHSDRGCAVSFTSDQYTITSDRSYSVGDEVSICYGEYCNDSLLSEYGFCPDTNTWDKVCLNDLILPKLKADQRVELDSNGFSSEHIVREVAVCHKVRGATHLLCSFQKEWDSPLNEWNIEEMNEALISQTLRKFVDNIERTKSEIDQLDVEKQVQKTMLISRWEQIAVLLSQFLET